MEAAAWSMRRMHTASCQTWAPVLAAPESDADGMPYGQWYANWANMCAETAVNIQGAGLCKFLDSNVETVMADLGEAPLLRTRNTWQAAKPNWNTISFEASCGSGRPVWLVQSFQKTQIKKTNLSGCNLPKHTQRCVSLFKVFFLEKIR